MTEIIIDPSLSVLTFHVEKICQFLNIRKIEIKPAEFNFFSHIFGSCAVAPDQIYIDLYEPGMHAVRVLAHELRHIHQYQTGVLSTGNPGFHYWNGKLFPARALSVAGYFALPWERDANEFAHWYMETCARDLETDAERERHRRERLPDMLASKVA